MSTPSVNPLPLSFACKSCGATTSYDAREKAAKCAFCGSPVVMEAPPAANRISPTALIPFQVPEAAAFEKYREWIGSGWFRPGDLAKTSFLQEIRGVYLPFWAVSAAAHSNWTADSGRYHHRTETYQANENGQLVTRTRQVQDTHWTPVSGQHDERYVRELVCASKGLDQPTVQRLEPFHYNQLQPYQPAFLAGWAAEDYGLQPQDAQVVAEQQLREKEQQACSRLVPGDTQRNLRVNTTFYEVQSELIYLPVWLAAFNYKDKLYRIFVNGQTGEVVGDAPVSYVKIGALVAVIAVVLIVTLVLIAGSR